MISAIEIIAAIAVPSLAQTFAQAQLMVDMSRLSSTDYLAMAPEQ
jgi:Tfp pilus assembly protein FimT